MIAEDMTYLSIFMLGLFSAPHCAGMCGGIVAALGTSAASQNLYHALQSSVTYNLGRVTMYVLLGAVMGTLGMTFQQYIPVIGSALRLASAILLVSMGCYIAGWWLGLRRFENFGYRLLKPIQGAQLARWPLPGSAKLFLTGVVWGCLPCGLVYTMLTLAMTTGSLKRGATAMLVFGLGTMPILLLTGALADRMMLIVRQKFVRSLMGLLIIVFGLWTLFGAFGTGEQHQHHHGMVVESFTDYV